MIARNTGETIAPPAVTPRPIEIDGRMHAWEWLVAADGTIVKTDALDHHDAHDLVGCQDVAWDVAGAAIELGLDAEKLARALDADPALVEFLTIAYLAFQLGRHTLAADQDEGRNQRAADRYAAELLATLRRRSR
jgi:hypothetical protein